MAQERKGAVTMRGNPLTLVGPELKAGDRAPDFKTVDASSAPASGPTEPATSSTSMDLTASSSAAQ